MDLAEEIYMKGLFQMKRIFVLIAIANIVTACGQENGDVQAQSLDSYSNDSYKVTWDGYSANLSDENCSQAAVIESSISDRSAGVFRTLNQSDGCEIFNDRLIKYTFEGDSLIFCVEAGECETLN